AVARQAVMDMEVLLEVVLEREVEERSPGGGELHRGRQAAVADRDIAGGEPTVEPVHIPMRLEAVGARQAVGIQTRTRDQDHAKVGDELLGYRERGSGLPEQGVPYSGPARGHDADFLARLVAKLGTKLLAIGQLRRSKA